MGGGGGGADEGPGGGGPGGGGGAAPPGAGGGDVGDCAAAGLAGFEGFSPAADSGRGGAIVPNRIDASAAALLPPGRPSSSSESSSSSSLSDPHPSSLGRLRDTGPVGVGTCTGAALGSCVMRWKGLVEASAAGGAGGAGAAGAAGGDEAGPDVIILKYGFLLSFSGAGLTTVVGGDWTGAGGGGDAFLSSSWLLIWLPACVGVDA